MSTEGYPNDSLVHLPYHREAIGQIRFDPSDELKVRLAALYQPPKRDLARRGLYLSSQYRMIAEQAPDGVIRGEAGQKAEHLRRALGRSVSITKRLSAYMRQADAVIDDKELFALQFAVHLDRATITAIDSDQTLASEPILQPKSTTIKVLKVYEVADMVGGRERDRAIRSLGSFVTGMEVMPHGGGDERIVSSNNRAYVENARFTFTQVRRR